MTAKDLQITYLKGVGEKRAKLYEKLGIKTIFDLLTYYPRDYIDYSSPVPIADIPIGESGVFKAEVKQKLKPYFGRINIFKAIIGDDSTEILCTFFNSEFTFAKLEVGKEYIFSGKIDGTILLREMNSPIFISSDQPNKLTPKYKLTAGISNNVITMNIHSALCGYEESDLLSDEICEKYSLCSFKTALEKIHFPQSPDDISQAKKRLVFQELLVLQLGLSILKKRSRKKTTMVMEDKNIGVFLKSLPFTPTNAQIKAISDCVNDMQKKIPMNRLLQGDVGSGKTLVAAAACYFAALNGCQSSLMAPTEILAKQHFKTLCDFLNPMGISVALLTGSMTPAEKKAIKKHIECGNADVVVGTQALIQKGIVFKKLGLTITDEQHRFGVGQRSDMVEKGRNPHTLVMSATPIPRTLALIIYGDLDLSVLNEMPKGRIPIKTYGVDSSYRPRLYRFIIKYVNEGKQAYIVCPMIDEGTNEKTSAVKYYDELCKTYFKDIPVGLLHGKMKQNEKDEVMEKYKNKELMVLISTTVIEVGVDVPNAVIMMIENAEQFGLSQLHQLRGRVGRGSDESHCILVTDNTSEYTKARIDTMVATSNGFEIANTDLKLRGPGDFFGSKQHGLPQLKIADMTEDTEVLETTRKLCGEIISSDENLSSLENKGLRKLVTELFQGGEKFGFN